MNSTQRDVRSNRTLVAHLMRRAGFGVTSDELDAMTRDKSYEEIVDDLVHPERFEELDESFIDRYYSGELLAINIGKWLYRMVNTRRHLEEKMTLFLHHIFPVAWGKSEHGPSLYSQIDMFRKVSMTNMPTILTELSSDPAMIFWLDNNENHREDINENFGRELLELFSMGIGNYTEDDIKAVSRAFTGWTFRQPLSLYPVGHYPAEFEFIEDDHDYESKTFLGKTGCFNGGDIVDIIVKQPATANFISRHLYNFFVEDEPPVSSWSIEPPRNVEAIRRLAGVFMETGGQIRPLLKYLFNSDFFKEATCFKKVKSPTELIVGVLKQTGEFNDPTPGIHEFGLAVINNDLYEGTMSIMGQRLMSPPNVEGWHTGHEWIDSGTLSERISFVEEQFQDTSKQGVKSMVNLIGNLNDDPVALVDRCLGILGAIYVSEQTYDSLIAYAKELKAMQNHNGDTIVGVHNLIQMITATVDYQFE